jgi:ATP-dependent helicase HrpA
VIPGKGHAVEAYPALIDEGDSVAVRLLATETEQEAAMWRGTIRLLLLNLPSPGKLLRPFLTPDTKELLRVGPHQNQTEWVEDCLGCAVGEIMSGAGGPAWDATAFDRLLQLARDELAPRITAVARTSLEILEALGDLERVFNRPAVQKHKAALADVANQAASLIYPGFLTAIGSDRLADVRRYLEAATRRIERLPRDPDGDLRHMNTIEALEAELERLRAALPNEPRLNDVAWLIEELRVSLFAQVLGTREKVSEKRIRQLMRKIEMG